MSAASVLAPATQATPDDAPSLGLIHAAQVLNGLGTMLLGPILPLLAVRWHLVDAQSGLLLLSQFCGAFLGGVTTSSRLRRDTLHGLLAAALGMLGFALAPSLLWACVGLAIGGFGIGRAITTLNILAGNRYAVHRGSALSRINLSWSFGALLSPLLASWLTPRVPLPDLLVVFAALFACCAVALWFQSRGADPESASSADARSHATAFPAPVYLYFLALLFLYGGLETCLNGWLTTFSLRYGQNSLVLSQYTMVLLLIGLTAGRALSAWLLLHLRDRTLARIALALSAALAAALSAAHRMTLIASLAVLLGIALAPIFPATFAMLLAHRPPARKAGIVMAASGLGAAALPALMGLLSTRFGSLQQALLVPVAAALALLALSFLPLSAEHAGRSPQP